MLHNIILDSDGYLDCEASDAQHVAVKLQGDCMELHVVSNPHSNLNERTAGLQSQWCNLVKYLYIIMSTSIKVSI